MGKINVTIMYEIEATDDVQEVDIIDYLNRYEARDWAISLQQRYSIVPDDFHVHEGF